MLMLKNILILLLAVILVSCATNQPLTHNYQGDIEIRTLRINFQSMQESKPEESGGTGLISAIKQIQQAVQDIEEMFNPNKNERLKKQLIEFQNEIVSGIKRTTGIPLLTPPEVEFRLAYDEQGELADIEYQYPARSGATLDLQAYVYYPETSSLSYGVTEANVQSLTVKPQLVLDVTGENEKGETFWRHSYRYTSKKKYTLSNSYFLGVSTSKIEDGQIFLIPLAKGMTGSMPSFK